MAEDSSYGGQNLLNNDSLSVEFNEDGSNTLSVSGFSASWKQALLQASTH